MEPDKKVADCVWLPGYYYAAGKKLGDYLLDNEMAMFLVAWGSFFQCPAVDHQGEKVNDGNHKPPAYQSSIYISHGGC